MLAVGTLWFAAESPAPPLGPAADCQAWSDGCRICVRASDGTTACSTPGIACQPGPIICRRPAKP